MENLTDLKCPECKGTVIEKEKLFECENHKYDIKTKESSGCSFVLFKHILNKKISLATLKKLVNGETIQVENFVGVKGKAFNAGIKLSKNDAENKYKIELIFEDKKDDDDDDKEEI